MKRAMNALVAMALVVTLVICAPLAANAATDAEPLFPICENGLWGYMNARGETVLEPQWENASEFRGGGYAAVGVVDGGEGIIDREGNYVLPPEYTLDEGYDGYYYGGKDTGVIWAVGENEKLGFFSVQHGVFSGARFGGMCKLTGIGDGLVCVCDDNEVYGYASCETGELVIPFQYRFGCGQFEDGFAYAYTDMSEGGFDIIDKTGKKLKLPKGIEPYSYGFSEGKLAVHDTNSGLYGFADATGAVVIPAVYEDVQDFSEGYAAVSMGGLWGHIDAEGSMVCEPKYSSETRYKFINGYAVLNDGVATTVIDTKGDALFTMKGISIGIFNENGIARYSEEDNSEGFGIIDASGNILLSADAGYVFDRSYEFEYMAVFAEGLQVVMSKYGLYGFIDESGKVAIDLQYAYAENFRDGLAYVRMTDDKRAYINHEGAIVWQEP